MADLIYRQDAIDAALAKNPHDITFIDGESYIKGFRDGYMAKENDCIENIANLPSIEPKTGKWIPKFDGKFTGGAYWFSCSECSHVVAGGLQSGNKYCSECGAKMQRYSDA